MRPREGEPTPAGPESADPGHFEFRFPQKSRETRTLNSIRALLEPTPSIHERTTQRFSHGS
jgi:hypothetical protein